MSEQTINDLNKKIEDLIEFIKNNCHCYMGHEMLYCEQNEDKLKELGIQSYANSPRHILRMKQWKKKQEN